MYIVNRRVGDRPVSKSVLGGSNDKKISITKLYLVL